MLDESQRLCRVCGMALPGAKEAPDSLPTGECPAGATLEPCSMARLATRAKAFHDLDGPGGERLEPREPGA